MEELILTIQDLSAARSLSEIIDIVRKAARKITGADGATFVLRDEGYCFYVDEDAIGPLWKGKRFPLSACISGWSMLNKTSVVIPNVFEDPRIPIEAYKPTFVKSLAMMPIRRRDPIAAIGIYWASHHEATVRELAVLQALADTTSVAIENVHLLSSLKDRVHELENANRVKDEFLMLISHELRTPLSAIIGWSQMLEDGEVTEPVQVKQGLRAISRNARVQCKVVDDLIEASSLALGPIKIHSERLNFSELLRDVMLDMGPQFKEKDLHVNFKSSLKTGTIAGDYDRLEKAIRVLLDNAIKFSRPQGQVLVQLSQEGPSLCLKVRDYGIGMDLKTQAHLFNRFKQGEDYMTRTHGGLGLGLSIAKSIIEAHRGEISVTSEGPGQGSEFTVSLPMFDSKINTREFVSMKSAP